jgi:hypothetical protein
MASEGPIVAILHLEECDMVVSLPRHASIFVESEELYELD